MPTITLATSCNVDSLPVKPITAATWSSNVITFTIQTGQETYNTSNIVVTSGFSIGRAACA